MRAGATEQVTTKLNALIPAAFDAKHFSDTFKETVCNVQQLDHRKLMKPYSDGWVELVVPDFLARKVRGSL